MAAVLPLYLLVVLLLAIPFLFFKSRCSAPRRGAGDRAGPLLPGAWALPVIGHLAGALPQRGPVDLAQRHGPPMMLRLSELDDVVVSSLDVTREIMKTHDASFASRPLTSMQQMAYGDAEDVIFAGDAWRQLRKICTVEILSSRRVESFHPAREEELGQTLRSVVAAASASSSSVNRTERISAFVVDSTMRAEEAQRGERGEREEEARRGEEELLVHDSLMVEGDMLVLLFCVLVVERTREPAYQHLVVEF
ncbi:Premnaspirodiene oxygenase [Hordeum vulgare]|nr:Premnaspirodiene oxygenase [Hordeum vulgare]